MWMWQGQLTGDSQCCDQRIIQDIEACRPKETAITAQFFCANDGAVAGIDSEKVQTRLTNHAKRFSRVGLQR
jgi:hypothetical protein